VKEEWEESLLKKKENRKVDLAIKVGQTKKYQVAVTKTKINLIRNKLKDSRS